MAEIRRIVKHGGGCSVNLPRRMVQALGLRIGDHVIIELRDEQIHVIKLNTKGVQAWGLESGKKEAPLL